MQTPTLLVVAVLLSSTIATGLAIALRPAAIDGPALNSAAEAIQGQLARLEQRQEELEQRLAAAPQHAVGAGVERVAVPTLGDEEIAAALQKYLAAHGLPAGTVEATAGKPVDAAVAFAELKAAHGNFWKNPDAWKRVFAAGKMDELIKLYEADAKNNPNDPQAQFDLANAYLAYLQLDQSKAPVLGMKSDRALDKVLDLDENHWGARFTKAVSYSFWPDFLGKKKEAMAQFDRLVTQQETMPIEAEQAQTYLFYGNMLDQSGQGEKAKSIWQKGLARHPNDAELKKRLGL